MCMYYVCMYYVNMYKDIKSEILNSIWKESILRFSSEILKTTLASNDNIYPSTTKGRKELCIYPM